MRADNTASIVIAAQRRRELTRAKAIQALRELERTGAPVTFQVAVGTALAGGPPHRSQRAGLPHWAPALGFGVKPHVRVRVHDADFREPSDR